MSTLFYAKFNLMDNIHICQSFIFYILNQLPVLLMFNTTWPSSFKKDMYAHIHIGYQNEFLFIKICINDP